MNRYIDLSHVIYDKTVTYPGDKPASIKTLLNRDESKILHGGGDSAGCIINEICIVSTSGTYIDAPNHVFEDGHSIKDYPLEKLVNIPGVVVRLSNDRNYFDCNDIDNIDVCGKAILFFTGHDKFFMTEKYGVNSPYLTHELAKLLVEKKAAFVGIDTPLVDNIDRMNLIGVPVHYELLANEIPICEDMTNISKLPNYGFTITAVPPRIDVESFPARVFATIDLDE